MRERVATAARPYAYTLSGLDNVRLVGVQVRRCGKCGIELPIIPRIAELHRLIAKALVELQRPLRGQEIRFLRKYAGMAARDFAAMLGIRHEHLSRVENGRTATLGRPADRLTRAIAMLMVEDPEAARQVLLKAATLVSPVGQAARPFTLVAGRRWKRAA
jgi:DNA-binding transcriptional regulator YiaG